MLKLVPHPQITHTDLLLAFIGLLGYIQLVNYI